MAQQRWVKPVLALWSVADTLLRGYNKLKGQFSSLVQEWSHAQRHLEKHINYSSVRREKLQAQWYTLNHPITPEY